MNLTLCHACKASQPEDFWYTFGWMECGIRMGAFFCSLYCIPTVLRLESE